MLDRYSRSNLFSRDYTRDTCPDYYRYVVTRDFPNQGGFLTYGQRWPADRCAAICNRRPPSDS